MKSMEKKTRTMCLAAIVAGVASATASAASNLALTVTDAFLNDAAGNNKVVVKIAVAGDAVNAVAAQFILSYDETKLSLDEVGSGSGNYYSFDGTKLDLELYESHDANTGSYSLAIGADGADAGEDPNANESISGNIVTLTFTPLAEFCEATDLVAFVVSNGNESMLSNVAGNVALDDTGATNLGEVTYDITEPTFSSIPSNQSYWADANGSNAAAHTFTSPTASDGCDSDEGHNLTVTYTRSDNANNLTSWPAGSVTTVTWSVTDDCGNTQTVSRTVDVSADSLAVVSAAQSGAVVANSFTRGLRLEISKAGATTETELMTASMAKAGSGGTSRAESSGNTVQLAGSVNWASSACARVSDPLHTLRRVVAVSTSSDTGSHSTRSYNSRYIVNGVDSSSDWLLVGNANQDTKIDILDFGVFASQRNASVALDTTSSTSGPHCDFNASSDDTGGTADVTNADLSFLAITFFSTDEACGSYTGDAPLSRISVKELRRSGQGHLAAGDVNGDGWVDTTDLALMLQGQGGQPVRTGSSSSGNVAW